MHPSTRTLAAVVVVALLVGTALGAGGVTYLATDDRPRPGGGGDGSGGRAGGDADVGAFSSEQAFRDYLTESANAGGGVTGGGFAGGVDTGGIAASAPAVERASDGATSTGETDGGSSPESTVTRFGGTNVQVAGVDEPDVLKTHGVSTFFARGGLTGAFPTEPVRADSTVAPERPGGVTVLDTSTPTAPSVASTIDAQGELLLAGNTLLVLSGTTVQAYDVSDRDDPTKTWTKQLNGRLSTARLHDGRLYLVVVDGIHYDSPCPIRPVSGGDTELACSKIYHPTAPTSVDATYTTLVVDPATGEVDDAVSFVGSYNSVTTMSANALYVSYTRGPSYGSLYLDFLLTEERDRLPASVVSRLERLQTYDLSDAALSIETQRALGRWYASLDADERTAVRTELANDWRVYLDDNKREIVETGIVKVGLDGGLSVDAVGSVPGTPLNQFSMDEHEGHLRIATTVGAWGTETENDVYVLDGDLDVVGSVQGMGVDERVFAVRFVGDEGYVVTFRQVDPFYVLDLSEPTNPTLEGEVKLPGFSSYLHPVGEDRILGVGQVDGRVKVVLFDVSDPRNPRVVDDYVLEEGWSAIQSNHHAFLHDPKHGVVFVPGARGGYVLSYEDGLSLERVVSTQGVQRATYLDDSLYVFGSRELVVVDEVSWERVTTLSLDPVEADRDGATDD